MTKTAKQILLEAADLIEQQGKWTQGCSARDTDGVEVYADSERAVCFCGIGAIARIQQNGPAYWAAVNSLGVAISSDDELLDFADYNDAPGRTASEVAAMMRKAAETVT